MPHLLLRELPRYECLLEAAKKFPQLDPSAVEAYLHLLRAGDDAFRVSHQHLQSCGISRSRFLVLMLLSDHCEEQAGEVLTPARLAEMTGVSRAAMTGLVDTLEKEGLVTRCPSTADRRMLELAITEAGLAKLEAMLPEHFATIGRLMTRLDENERKTLVRLVEKISSQADEMHPAAEEPEFPAD